MNNATTDACRNCGTPFDRNMTGRPASFCSIGCRRAAEYRCRRLQDRLARLENEAEACRRDRTGFLDWRATTKEDRAQDIAREHAAAEGDLAELLAALAGTKENSE